MSDSQYVLRLRDRQEIARLKLQHEVWKDPTDQVLRMAGLQTGHRALDLGCGPGYLSFDLAHAVGEAGHVCGVDDSEIFISHLNQQSLDSNVTNVSSALCDLSNLELEASSWDLAICRWVLMFIDQPERVLRRVARALRPGGTFVAMEYFQFKSMSLWPHGTCFKHLYDAVYRLITQSGGDPDLGGKLPQLLTAAGLEVVDLMPILRVGRPGTPMWEWLTAHNENHANLVESGLLSQQELDGYHREFNDHAQNPSAFFTAPPVLATIARRL